MVVPLKWFEDVNLIELSSVFMLVLLILLGPTIAFLSYAVGTLFYQFVRKVQFGRIIRIRAKIATVLLNTAAYGSALIMASSRFSFELEKPGFLFARLIFILAVQTLLVTLFLPLYYCILDAQLHLYWKKLYEHLQWKNLRIEALQVILFPGLALLVALIWDTPHKLGVLLLLVPFYFFRKSMKEPQETRESLFSTVLTGAEGLKARDRYTGHHCDRVGEFTVTIGRHLGLNEVERDELEKVASLHDLGKVRVSDVVLLKQGKLTDEEYRAIKKHTELKEVLLDYLPQEFEATKWIDIARHHHERWDGKGYPDQWQGEQIPLYARIMAVADAWDAMTTNRVYRQALPIEKALDEIQKNSGTQFDPKAAQAFMDAFQAGEIQTIMEKHKDEHGEHEEEEEEKLPAEALQPATHERLLSAREVSPSGLVRLKIKEMKPLPKHDFSTREIFLKSFNSFYPFALGILLYFLPFSSDLKIFFFFLAVVLTMEQWNFKDPLRYAVSFGDAAFIASFFLFPESGVLLLLALGIFIPPLLYRARSYSDLKESFWLVPSGIRFLVFAFSSLIFEKLHLEGTTEIFSWMGVGFSSMPVVLEPLLRFFLWIVVYGALRLMAEHIASRRHSYAFRSPEHVARFFHFCVFNLFVLPILGYTLYFLHDTKLLPLPYPYLVFLPFVFLSFLAFKINAETLQAARRATGALSVFFDGKLQFRKFHALNVATLTQALAEDMGYNEHEVEWIVSAARVSDIGSIQIPDEVFLSPKSLSPADLRAVEHHCEWSAKIVGQLPLYRDLLGIIRSHHERWDGKGYPRGFKGKEIPMAARVIAVADVFDAMISPRPDRDPLPVQEAINEIKAKSGTQFDPEVVKALLRLYAKEKIQLIKSDL